ncbi:MAG: RND transporter [endosymbiont of Seepiophila jonesi]|uniref:RND transporter n=1 Tax=endosymbiont of Lamellibrachia luymesi TaxID=2200907 RepID=A0A370DYD1_9GAMM|nr:MAG: RND transporter [endosymbiont of Lamellibrachia luymesi]RDH93607.1 MAG: RND transporter [endosymbiont of Seepiophila jonesi]
MFKRLIWFSMDYPRTTLLVVLLATLAFGLQFPKIHIDTDPENMLPADQADRVLYNQAKQDFGIHDLVVLGITDEAGAFRPKTLAKVSHIIDGILKTPGVITEDVISLTTTDDVRPKAGLLEVRRIMEEIPTDAAQAEAMRAAIADNPLLNDKLASQDGTALAIYIPIQSKDRAHDIGMAIAELVEAELEPGQAYHLAGLPVAEDTFGTEMFVQMGMLAPACGMMIFLLLWGLFRKLTFILPVMAVSMFTVAWAMGLLIGLGYTVHIMSSMIPVFIMPIAVLDSVHILSDFYDRYPRVGDRRETLRQSIGGLYKPMLFTSLTSMAGFASLMLADIPPVQVFGGFMAFGILAAFLLTITFIPASVMLMREKRLQAAFGRIDEAGGWLGRVLPPFGSAVFRRAIPIALAATALLGVGIYGVSRTVVNDNPVEWFSEGHPLRIADREMNRLFGGTYMAYLVVEGKEADDIKRPEVLGYLARLQRQLEQDPVVGKTSSLADIVGQVGYVLHDGDPDQRRVPDDREALAQYLFLYQMSGDAGDLDNFVDYDYRLANIWVQMRQGQNRDMSRVVDSVNAFMATEPPPAGILVSWSGLTYINKVWQDEMVWGMMKAVMAGFAVVLAMMALLLRSATLGLLSMLPLTFAITLSYGLAALVGKEYDMPLAVCSTLTLGLSIDFAIHFVQRFRTSVRESAGKLEAANRIMFGEPARAIARNALVVAIAFLPLVLSPLGPYKTVGTFFALLMSFTALTTLALLPGLLRLTHGRLWVTK